MEVDFNNHTVTMFTDPGVIARTPLLWVGFSGLAALILREYDIVNILYTFHEWGFEHP